MNWASLQQFFAMDGHGFYVWSAYGLVLIVLLWQWLIPWRRWQRYRKQLKKYEQSS